MLQRVVAQLYVLGDLATFRRRVVELLPDVVAGDVVVYTEIDPASRRMRWHPDNVDALLGWPEGPRIFARHMGDLPLFRSYRRGEGSATKISDHLTRRAFHRTPIYNEFYRRLGLEHQMSKGLPGPAGLVTSLSVLRGGRDFSERHRLLLDLLRPHLNQAYRNAQAVDVMQNELAALRDGVEALDHGLVVLDAEGRVAHMTARARQWIAQCFGTTTTGAGLPDSLARWTRHARQAARGDDAPLPRAPLTIERPDGQLVIRLVPTGEQSVLMLTWRPAERSPDALDPLGLSPREAEVLTWVAKGKTNAEIAIILGTSVRTIDKHLERVFRKLGVETRTAAARAMFSA